MPAMADTPDSNAPASPQPLNYAPASTPAATLRSFYSALDAQIHANALAEAGIVVDDLVTVGGLAKSEPFLQLKATMMGKKVTTLHVSEAGTLGVAILAGTASGVYRSLEDGVEQLVRRKKVFYPDERLHEQYLDMFETYKRIYPPIRQIYRST